MEVVAHQWHTTVEALVGRDRSQKVVEPRQVVMYLLRKISNTSYPQIGAAMGGRDHTTVMYSIEKISRDMESKPDLYNRIRLAEQQLFGSLLLSDGFYQEFIRFLLLIKLGILASLEGMVYCLCGASAPHILPGTGNKRP
jgi:hypothetical protein